MGRSLPLLAPAGLGVVALAWGAHALAGARPPEPSPAARTAEDPAAPGLVLPDGAVARAWALVGPETQPATLPGEWSSALGPGCWDDDRGPKTWGTWVRLVHQASNGAAEERPRARVGLALLAAADAQPQVAWGHAAALAESPRWTATLVPRLLPGVPLDHPLGPGGLVEPLTPGTHLRPLPPPLDPDLPSWAMGAGVATFGGLMVGEARVDLMVEVQPAGVEVALTHRAGPAARVTTELPRVRGAALRTEYLDFVRQDDLHGARDLVVAPTDEEPRVLYGRLVQSDSDLPAAPAGAAPLPRALSEAGLRLVPAPGAPDCEPVAAALSELLGLPVELGSAEGAGRATVVRVPAGEAGRAVLRTLRASVEARLLAPR